MLFLIGAILCSFSIGMIIKFSETKKNNSIVVLFFNYLVAALCSLVIAGVEGDFSISLPTLLLGVVGGIIWPISFFLLMRGIRLYGMSITGSLARLSLAVPVLIAVVFLGEALTLTIVLGLTLTFAAFFMINPVRRDKLAGLDTTALFYLGLLILVLGCSDFWMNMFKLHGIAEERTMFLTLIFGVAGLITLAIISRDRLKFTRSAAISGAVLGLPNYFSSFLLLEALKDSLFTEQSAVVYSLYSASILVLTFAAGVLFWNEKVRLINVVGALAAIIAIVLLNFAA